MPTEMKHLTIYLPQDIASAVEVKARSLGMSQASLLRELVTSHVKLAPALPGLEVEASKPARAYRRKAHIL